MVIKIQYYTIRFSFCVGSNESALKFLKEKVRYTVYLRKKNFPISDYNSAGSPIVPRFPAHFSGLFLTLTEYSKSMPSNKMGLIKRPAQIKIN